MAPNKREYEDSLDICHSVVTLNRRYHSAAFYTNYPFLPKKYANYFFCVKIDFNDILRHWYFNDDCLSVQAVWNF